MIKPVKCGCGRRPKIEYEQYSAKYLCRCVENRDGHTVVVCGRNESIVINRWNKLWRQNGKEAVKKNNAE